MVGILENGEIFVWHKDKDIIKFISGLKKLTPDFSQGMFEIDSLVQITNFWIGSS